ncbi:MAG: DNA repair protein RecN [Gemmatimonadaceae bacterium]|nr:DNA repair protein RecN [Gemmatimonadaceae bacterium]
MLAELRIRDFALIEQVTVRLAPGFNVLTGETGAGKSIIVGALGLLLGERASADVVRVGRDKAIVEGTFEIERRPELRALLDELGLDADEGPVVLRREVAANGRARAWVNGTSVTAAVLAQVGRRLVDLHGQHEAQTLLDEASQRAILDAFAGATADADAMRTAHATLALVRRERETLEQRRAEATKRADWLRHVVHEIDAARLEPGEDDRLEDEARRLEHADELRALAAQAVVTLEAEAEGVLDRLGSVRKAVAHLERLDPSQAELHQQILAAEEALQSAARELSAYAEAVEPDPVRLATVQQRRELLYKLQKKHGPTLADVIRVGADARAELDLVDAGGLDVQSLAAREREAEQGVAAAAARLSAKRTAAASRLAEAVSRVLPALGMPDGAFAVSLAPRVVVTADGAEEIAYRVRLNAGHEERPLARVASGGELARVMLALKTVLAQVDRVPTLIFDEVDAGIGGAVGLQVGDAMRGLAGTHQVFAITHLPQIAARAHHHVLVAKAAKGGITTTDVALLDGDDRVREISRMLGGDPDSDVGRAHARELLASGASAPTSTSAASVASRSASAARRAKASGDSSR